MAQYLLAENTLIDLCYPNTPAQQWLAQGIKSTELFTSVIAVEGAKETIDAQAPDPVTRSRLNHTLRQVLARLINGGMTVLPFEEDDAQEWIKWRWHHQLQALRGQHPQDINQDSRMVIATAAARALQFVEPNELYHSTLLSHGMMVISL
jgi:hypothetical protein